MAFASDVLTIEIDDHIATLWLDRPDKRNAMGPEFWRDLPRAMAEIGADPEVRAVVIAAKGKSFTAGLDLAAMGGALGGEGSPAGGHSTAVQNLGMYETIKRMQASITAVADSAVPVIAAVHSHCIGGGVDLITACDIRVAAADSVFSVRETKIAIVADVGTLQRLPNVVAPGHVAELAYTGKDIDADRAREIGLVNDVYPDAEATHAAARGLAAEIAANSPVVVRGIKSVLNARDDLTEAQALDYVALWNTSFLQTNDLTEAMVAYAEKRPPDFQGN